MVEGKSKGKRRLDIECMRILAAFFVIFNHTETTGFFLFSYYDTHGIRYWLYLFISIFCKFSVPLFFMISGALMLNRISEPLKQLWHHRIFHMCYMASTFQEKMPAMSYSFLYCGVIFICSYVVTAIIRKIPILKKIVS